MTPNDPERSDARLDALEAQDPAPRGGTAPHRTATRGRCGASRLWGGDGRAAADRTPFGFAALSGRSGADRLERPHARGRLPDPRADRPRRRGDDARRRFRPRLRPRDRGPRRPGRGPRKSADRRLPRLDGRLHRRRHRRRDDDALRHLHARRRPRDPRRRDGDRSGRGSPPRPARPRLDGDSRGLWNRSVPRHHGRRPGALGPPSAGARGRDDLVRRESLELEDARLAPDVLCRGPLDLGDLRRPRSVPDHRGRHSPRHAPGAGPRDPLAGERPPARPGGASADRRPGDRPDLAGSLRRPRRGPAARERARCGSGGHPRGRGPGERSRELRLRLSARARSGGPPQPHLFRLARPRADLDRKRLSPAGAGAGPRLGASRRCGRRPRPDVRAGDSPAPGGRLRGLRGRRHRDFWGPRRGPSRASTRGWRCPPRPRSSPSRRSPSPPCSCWSSGRPRAPSPPSSRHFSARSGSGASPWWRSTGRPKRS